MTLSPVDCNQLSIPQNTWGQSCSLEIEITKEEGVNKYNFTAQRIKHDRLGPLTITGTFSRLDESNTLQGEYEQTSSSKNSDLTKGRLTGTYDLTDRKWTIVPEGYAREQTWTLSKKV